MSPGSTELSDAEFVVVANRLPVDLEELPDGSQRWKQQPGRPGHRDRADPAQPGGAPGSAGPGTPDVDLDPFVDGGMQLHPVSLSEQEVEDYYEGFSNGTLWPLYHDAVVAAGLPPALVAGLRGGQRAVRRGGRARSPRRARPSGCTTTSCSWSRPCCASCARTCGSGSSCTSRSRRSSCSCGCRGAGEIIEGLLGADLVGFQTARRRPQLRRLAAPAHRRARRAGRASRSTFGGPDVHARRLPDLHRLGGARRARRARRRCMERGQAAAQRPRRPGQAHPRASTGSTTPRASTCGCGPSRSCSSRSDRSARDTVMVQIATPSRERVEHYTGMRDDDRAARRADQRRRTAGSASRPCTTCTSRCRARSWSRSTSRPT